MRYGIRKAPPPLSSAVNGKRHTLPRPTDMAMQDMRNSRPLPQVSRSPRPAGWRDLPASWSPSDSVGCPGSDWIYAVYTDQLRSSLILGSLMVLSGPRGGLLTDIGNVLAVLCPSSPTNAGFCCVAFMLLTLQSVREETSSVSCHRQYDTNREFSLGSSAQLFSAEL